MEEEELNRWRNPERFDVRTHRTSSGLWSDNDVSRSCGAVDAVGCSRRRTPGSPGSTGCRRWRHSSRSFDGGPPAPSTKLARPDRQLLSLSARPPHLAAFFKLDVTYPSVHDAPDAAAGGDDVPASRTKPRESADLSPPVRSDRQLISSVTRTQKRWNFFINVSKREKAEKLKKCVYNVIKTFIILSVLNDVMSCIRHCIDVCA